VTTYHFSGTVAWNRMGPFITTGKGLTTKTFTDPSTGLTPAGRDSERCGGHPDHRRR
jgi:hypothetical protein